MIFLKWSSLVVEMALVADGMFSSCLRDLSLSPARLKKTVDHLFFDFPEFRRIVGDLGLVQRGLFSDRVVTRDLKIEVHGWSFEKLGILT